MKYDFLLETEQPEKGSALAFAKIGRAVENNAVLALFCETLADFVRTSARDYWRGQTLFERRLKDCGAYNMRIELNGYTMRVHCNAHGRCFVEVTR